MITSKLGGAVRLIRELDLDSGWATVQLQSGNIRTYPIGDLAADGGFMEIYNRSRQVKLNAKTMPNQFDNKPRKV